MIIIDKKNWHSTIDLANSQCYIVNRTKRSATGSHVKGGMFYEYK